MAETPRHPSSNDRILTPKLRHMKKTLLLSLALLTATGIFAQSAIEIDGIIYTLNPSDSTATVYSDNQCSGDIIIPEEVTDGDITYQVTSIDGNAFYQNEKITSVFISGTMKSIGQAAFAYCANLTTVSIPNTVTDRKSTRLNSSH